MNSHEAYREFFDRVVVIDTTAPAVYIGRMIEANDYFVTLADADVHELTASSVSKELYVMEASRNGVQPNRKLVKVKQAEVLSLSCLDDIILY